MIHIHWLYIFCFVLFMTPAVGFTIYMAKDDCLGFGTLVALLLDAIFFLAMCLAMIGTHYLINKYGW